VDSLLNKEADMALIKCKECSNEMSDSAPACPHCGKPINSWSTKKDIKTGGYGILNNWCICGASD